ncbi:MAG: 5-(carboxyamino)imidazole ribonucleotide synthase [SAR324 cluster bacterium]|nr:5-(carboxyamino)imidazole ribonucleotide synthase [SAR324 cluster bacterium]MBL7034767.1 5-(carboxyamino)imidazole ribonucleotide synthase [SAR324 cluster bacterium]
MSPVLEPLRPGTTIGLLGGGQLAQMLVLAGQAMGFRFVVLDPTPDCPAALVGAEQITANYNDREALAKLADSSAVVTYEFENVAAAAVAWLENRVAVPPGSEILRIAQNRLLEKQFLEQLNIPVAPFQKITSAEEIVPVLETFGELMLKTVSGGYDGRGQTHLVGKDQIPAPFSKLRQLNEELVAEQFVSFEKEISVIVARNIHGEVCTFPVAENLHQKNILTISRIPASLDSRVTEQANSLAKKIAEGLDLVGVLGVEMFVLADRKLLVNELAPRPHNSGHFTQDACATSQFEQHLRAIANWPLGLTALRQPALMLNVLGEHLPLLLKKLKHLPPEAKLHLYGKQECRPGRKMGHLNFTNDVPELLLKPLLELEIWDEDLLRKML